MLPPVQWVEPASEWQNGTMKFRTGVVIGIGVGYVLGARAGRERYEQIKQTAKKAKNHPAVGQLVDQAVGVVDLARNSLAGGLSAGSKGLRSVAAEDETT